ncbi:MAG: hypothetical protein ACTSV5_13440 [Promethearchaeota archaeon]
MKKNKYPRFIVIFKPYDCDYFSIKSFEVFYDTKANEIHSEIYSRELIYGFQNLFTELIDANNIDEMR